MFEDSQWLKYSSRFRTLPSLLSDRAAVDGMIICMPIYAEPLLIPTLESILDCDPPSIRVEVIMLFNQNNMMTDAASAVHEQTWNACLDWVHQQKNSTIQFTPIRIDGFPDAKGGVGWARKVVMDEAARILHDDGIIVCLDADCIVEKNYLVTIADYFKLNKECIAASIYYEHKLEALDPIVRKAIVQYELHLRYLVHGMRWAGHPFAFQTVGSSMAVKRSAYLAQGGMNTRQAGEDFYFLQKFIELNLLEEISQTVVYPSSRLSNRVPFGTGRAMQKLLGDSPVWYTTDFEIFKLIKPLLASVDLLREYFMATEVSEPYDRLRLMIGLHPDVIQFLRSIDFITHVNSVYQHTTNLTSFRHRFFRYFNAFMMIRYMHFIRDHGFPDVPVEEASHKLAMEVNLASATTIDVEQLLLLFRRLDKK